MKPCAPSKMSTDELRPPPDFRRDALLLGQLSVHALSEQERSLGFHEQRDSEIDGVATHDCTKSKSAIIHTYP